MWTIESIELKLKVENQTVSFIVSYCPRFGYPGYVNHLEDVLLASNSRVPTFIIGDLNHNLLTHRGKSLTDVLSIYNFKCMNSSITRPVSSSLIDVIFSNAQSLDCNALTLGCPFSDHSFLLCSLSQISVSRKAMSASCVRARCLNQRSLEAIKAELANRSFGPFETENDINFIWSCYLNQLLAVIDTHAPVKKLRTRHIEQPWVDNELLKLMLKRDHLHDIVKSLKKDDERRKPYTE